MPTFVRIMPSVQAGCGLELTLNGVALFRKWPICCPVLILAAGTRHTVAYLLKVRTCKQGRFEHLLFLPCCSNHLCLAT